MRAGEAELPADLLPYLSPQKSATGRVIYLQEKQALDVPPEFRLYFTTSLPNPHILPELATAVTEGGIFQ